MKEKKILSFSIMHRMIVIRFLISGFLLCACTSFVQSQGTQEEIFVVADEMPSFPGGQKALMDFIYKNVSYPKDAKENGIEGKVILRFVVDKTGKAVQPTISKGLYASIDKMVLEVAGKIPSFIPGKKGGTPVSVWYAIPVIFKLSSN